MGKQLSEASVWAALEQVKDPEIPVVSVVEMGIVRAVEVEDDLVRVKMTPTFSGCPALHVMEQEIADCVRSLGAAVVAVEQVLSPPWTTDAISDSARQKLKDFGLSPPPRHEGDLEFALRQEAACPYCNSAETVRKNSFGSTACRAIYYCQACQQPFEQFKPL